MDQTNVEKGNTVGTLLYKKRINASVGIWRDQMRKKVTTEGIILGKGNYEFYKDENGKLVPVVPAKLEEPLKRVITSLERDGLVSSILSEKTVSEKTVGINSFAMEEATL